MRRRFILHRRVRQRRHHEHRRDERHGNCLSNVAALAAAVTQSWASTNSTSTSPIYVTDHCDSGFDPTNAADTSDGVHPTPAGAAIMATITYNAVAASGYF